VTSSVFPGDFAWSLVIWAAQWQLGHSGCVKTRHQKTILFNCQERQRIFSLGIEFLPGVWRHSSGSTEGKVHIRNFLVFIFSLPLGWVVSSGIPIWIVAASSLLSGSGHRKRECVCVRGVSAWDLVICSTHPLQLLIGLRLLCTSSHSNIFTICCTCGKKTAPVGKKLNLWGKN